MLPLFALGFWSIMDHNALIGKYLNIGYFCAIDIDFFQCRTVLQRGNVGNLTVVIHIDIGQILQTGQRIQGTDDIVLTVDDTQC